MSPCAENEEKIFNSFVTDLFQVSHPRDHLLLHSANIYQPENRPIQYLWKIRTCMSPFLFIAREFCEVSLDIITDHSFQGLWALQPPRLCYSMAHLHKSELRVWDNSRVCELCVRGDTSLQGNKKQLFSFFSSQQNMWYPKSSPHPSKHSCAFVLTLGLF